MSRAATAADFLDADEEYALACAWRDHKDEAALHKLIQAYMRLAISMAAKFRTYGVPIPDLIQEANLGLMKAADKFDPDRGVRFSTYAMWWVKASIQDHVMRNFSLVRTGSTTAQKSLFFNLRRIEAEIQREISANGQEISQHVLRKKVAETLGLSEADVEMMQGRLSGSDMSLDAPQSGDEEGRAWVETIADETDVANEVDALQDASRVRDWLSQAMSQLTAREKYILAERRLTGEPRTLEDLGRELGLSKERVRQVEAAAFAKMRNDLREHEEAIALFLR